MTTVVHTDDLCYLDDDQKRWLRLPLQRLWPLPRPLPHFPRRTLLLTPPSTSRPQGALYLYDAAYYNRGHGTCCRCGGRHPWRGPMFTDLLFNWRQESAGTLEWTADTPVTVGNFKVTKIEFYPVYVHWLKALFSPTMSKIPTNFTRLKQRLNQTSLISANLRNRSVFENDMMRDIHIEIMVSGRGRMDIGPDTLMYYYKLSWRENVGFSERE